MGQEMTNPADPVLIDGVDPDGEYHIVWGADLCGQVSQRSFWSWSL